MSFLITYRRKAGQGPIPVHAPGMNEDAARVMAGQLARLSHRVTLSELADNGAARVIETWIGGKRDASALNNRPAPRVIDHEPDAPADVEPYEDAAATTADEDPTDYAEAAEADDDHDDEAHAHEGYCVKCKQKRVFTGHVVERANGSRAAIGTCPVCGTKMSRMVARTTPLDEWEDEQDPVPAPIDQTAVDAGSDSDEPTPDDTLGILHILQRDDAGRGKVRLLCSCDEWETTVKTGGAAETRALAAFSAHAAEAEAPEDEPDDADDSAVTESDEDAGASAAAESLPEAVEAGVVSALEFSDAVQEDAELAPAVAEVVAEQTEDKPTPRKRAPRKSRAKVKHEDAPADDAPAEPTVSDADLERVKEMQVAPCPICGQDRVPYQSRANVTYFLTHPGRDSNGNATDRCPNSLGSDGLAKVK